MSLYAISWALALSEASGNDRLVVIVMSHHADEYGFAGVSRSTFAAETRLSEPTIKRSLDSLVALGEIVRCEGNSGPSWWREIPSNRRPGLYRMSAFLGSQFVPPNRSGGNQGANRGQTGDHATPSDLPVRDVNSLSLKPLNLGASQISELPKTKPPWLESGTSRDEWLRGQTG